MTVAAHAPLNGRAIPKIKYKEVLEEVDSLIKWTNLGKHVGFKTYKVGIRNFSKVKHLVFWEANKEGQSKLLEWDMDDFETRVELKSDFGGITFQKTAA